MIFLLACLAPAAALLAINDAEALVDYGLTVSIRADSLPGKDVACSPGKMACSGAFLRLLLRYKDRERVFVSRSLTFARASHQFTGLKDQPQYELRVLCLEKEAAAPNEALLVLPLLEAESGRNLGALLKEKRGLGRRVLALTNNYFEVYLY
jgi:hypothetical protein